MIQLKFLFLKFWSIEDATRTFVSEILENWRFFLILRLKVQKWILKF